MSRSLSYGELVYLARDILTIAERRRDEEFQAVHDAAVNLRDLGLEVGEWKLYRQDDERVIGVIRIGDEAVAGRFPDLRADPAERPYSAMLIDPGMYA